MESVWISFTDGDMVRYMVALLLYRGVYTFLCEPCVLFTMTPVLVHPVYRSIHGGAVGSLTLAHPRTKYAQTRSVTINTAKAS